MFATFIFAILVDCIWILVQAIDTLQWMVSKIYFRKNLIFVKNHDVRFWRVTINI